jgi:hypothetical protein
VYFVDRSLLTRKAIHEIGEFTHFVWIGTANMAAADKIGPAFAADRARRSEKERNEITAVISTRQP